MKTGQLYIAVSDSLLEWARDHDQLFLFKIGTTSSPEQRLRALNAGWPGRPDSGPCLNCTDWRWAERWHYKARARANVDENRLKRFLGRRWARFDRSVDARFHTRRPDGASEVFRIPIEDLPQLDMLTDGRGGNDPTRAVVVAAVAQLIRSEIERRFPAIKPEDDLRIEDDRLDDQPEADDGEDDTDDTDDADFGREHDELVAEMLADQDSYARSNEDGWYDDDA